MMQPKDSVSYSPIRFDAGASRLMACSMFALLMLVVSVVSSAATIGSGFSGMWYDSARSGEGLQLEILSPDMALVEWFTYDEQGKQRWLQGVGQIVHATSGDSIEFPQMYVTQGGKFGPAFDPKAVKIQAVGTVSLSFSDCGTGSFHYNAFGQSQTLPIERLTQAMGAGCQSINGVVGQPVMAYAGQSGSWYDTSHSGEGFDLQWLANGSALVTWYTYDTQGNQVWLLGVGTEQDGAIEFPQMAVTSGPHFGTAYNTDDYHAEDWGSLTLRIDCNGGTAHYASSQPAFGSGDLTLSRLTTLQQPACPYVPPKFTDLYHVTWDDIPIAEGTPFEPNILVASKIANDGTIAGGRNGHMVLWHPDTRTWEDIPRDLSDLVAISPDSSKVVATDAIPADKQQPISTLIWQRTTGWQELAGNAVSLTAANSVSKNFQFIVGYGRNPGEGNRPWIRKIDGAQRLLPLSEEIPAASPVAVSDDGNTVVGNVLHFQNDYPFPVAVRWIGNGPPTLLHDPFGNELPAATLCSADCSILFGNGVATSFADPHLGEVWYLKTDGAFGYLGKLPVGTIPDADPAGAAYYSTDATPDGSLVVGTYTAVKYPDYPDAGIFSARAFIWTQATGMVSVRSLVTELGIGDDDWQEVDTVSVSANGLNILISGFHMAGYAHNRSVVLHLTPKAQTD